LVFCRSGKGWTSAGNTPSAKRSWDKSSCLFPPGFRGKPRRCNRPRHDLPE